MVMYKPVDEVNKISWKQLDKVIERYPLIGKVHDIVKSFKNTLFSKEPDELEKWLDESEPNRYTSISKIKRTIYDFHFTGQAMDFTPDYSYLALTLFGTPNCELLILFLI